MLQATDLHKTYRRHANMVRVLNGLDLSVHDGEFLSIVGHSGSGKSTLMHLLGTLDRPDRGTISLEGRRIDNLSGRERDRLRNQTFGFIFQFYHLLPELTTLENVLAPMMVGTSLWNWFGRRREARKRAAEMLERVGLGHRLKHRPRELSGGEMQRTAIARALVTRPRVLFADEPTGNLDSTSGGEIIRLLRGVNREDGVTILMVTHNMDIVAATDRVVRMKEGRIVEEPLAACDERLSIANVMPPASPVFAVAR